MSREAHVRFWERAGVRVPRATRFELWRAADAGAEARAFLLSRFDRIVGLRAGGVPGARYASKNNANIARLELLPDLFADADIVVPVRDPLEQAASLWRQHL